MAFVKIITAVFFLFFLSSSRAQFQSASLISSGIKNNILHMDSNNTDLVVAGGMQFRSIWARDFSFSVPGLLKLGETKPVHDTLVLFFENRRLSDGLLPRLLDSMPFQRRVAFGLFGIREDLGPIVFPSFETENNVIALDGNLLLISAAWAYIQATHDQEFALKYWPAAQQLMMWMNQNHVQKGLVVNQAPFSDWADSVNRQGSVGFTQLLYARALGQLKNWADFVGDREQTLVDQSQILLAHEAILKSFWNEEGGYLKNTSSDPRLSADVNWGALAWNLVDHDHALLILQALEKSTDLVSPIPGRVLKGEYNSDEKSRFVKIVGLDGYHDRYYWLWLTALAVEAYENLHRPDKALEIRQKINSLLAAFQGVHEVYSFESGMLQPVKTWLYRAECPFTWSSSMLAEAGLVSP